MSPPRRKLPRRPQPEVFAALGDPTRLRVLTRLARTPRASLTQLTGAARISRQGMSKHLRVLEDAGLVRSAHVGRETLYEFNPAPLSAARGFLDQLSSEWDDALARLQTFVEH